MTLGEVGVCGVGVGFIVGHGLKNRGKNKLIHEAGDQWQRDGRKSCENTTEIQKKYTQQSTALLWDIG